MDTTTFVVCSKCGKSAEYANAKATGWLIASREGKPGYMIIRCPEHVTDHARRQAGMKQQYYHEKKASKQQ